MVAYLLANCNATSKTLQHPTKMHRVESFFAFQHTAILQAFRFYEASSTTDSMFCRSVLEVFLRVEIYDDNYESTQVYDSDVFRFRVGGGNYLFRGIVPRVYNPLLLLDLNAVFIKLVSITKQVLFLGNFDQKLRT